MQKSYKGYVIEITVANDPDSKSRWIPTCRILAPGSTSQGQEIEWNHNAIILVTGNIRFRILLVGHMDRHADSRKAK